MEIFLEEQLISIAESCLLGLIFGAGYDIIRITYILCHVAAYRRNTGIPVPHTKRAFAVFFTLDFVYMLTVTFFFSVFLFHVNHGIFRLYLFLPAIFGFCLYYHTMGRLIMFFSETIVAFLRRLICLVVFRPVMFLWRQFCRVVRFLWDHSIRKLVIYGERRKRLRYAQKLEKKFAAWVRL